jgi:hypothetical protein
MSPQPQNIPLLLPKNVLAKIICYGVLYLSRTIQQLQNRFSLGIRAPYLVIYVVISTLLPQGLRKFRNGPSKR